MEENEVCGSSLSMVAKAQLLLAWAPLLGKLEAVASAQSPHEKAIAIIDALRVAADKTTTAKDNAMLDHVEKILRTPEGVALVDWFVAFAKDVK